MSDSIMRPIDSQQPLAKAFNKVISKVSTLRIMTAPRIFADAKGEEASFKMVYYYQTMLWEKWMHEVVARLNEWVNIIDEYFDEFEGNWRYYALAKRLDFLKEYGSDEDDDYNEDGTFKTEGVTDEQLRYHTVFRDLYHDCVDIVQDCCADDLLPLIEAIDTNSRFSIIDVLQDMAGKKIPSYVMGDDGHLRETTFADRELLKARKLVEAQDYGQLVYAVADIMARLTAELDQMAHSDAAFDDQHALLYAIQSDAYALLDLKLKTTH